jgi:hypothetical protein
MQRQKQDYTAWAKGQDFFTKTVYEPEYIQKRDYTSWYSGITRQQINEQIDFDRQREQAGVREIYSAVYTNRQQRAA